VDIRPLEDEADRLARQIAVRNHPDVARAIRARRDAILRSWRSRSVTVLPDLDRLTIAEFENSMAEYIDVLAGAMDSHDPAWLRRIITESPGHGLSRFAQDCSTHTLLAEERIFRAVLILELREELGRPLTAEAAASLHELLDLMGEYSIMAMVAKRQERREDALQAKVSGLRRLADAGILVAGVAHDAMNILLPLHMRLEHLGETELSESAREDLASINLLVKQFQNSIVNLRWISVDSSRAPGVIPPLDLNGWSVEVAEFHRRMIPHSTQLLFELPPGLPPVRISSAALSQSVFNLIHNAQQAIASCQTSGQIVMGASVREDGGVDLTIEDDGPGMPPEVLARCTEAFFTTRHTGSGLGLALVQTLIHGSDGEVTLCSPPPGKDRGTRVVLTLPGVGAAAG
jgi:signal transduction histidine kinase